MLSCRCCAGGNGAGPQCGPQLCEGGAGRHRCGVAAAPAVPGRPEVCSTATGRCRSSTGGHYQAAKHSISARRCINAQLNRDAQDDMPNSSATPLAGPAQRSPSLRRSMSLPMSANSSSSCQAVQSYEHSPGGLAGGSWPGRRHAQPTAWAARTVRPHHGEHVGGLIHFVEMQEAAD